MHVKWVSELNCQEVPFRLLPLLASILELCPVLKALYIFTHLRSAGQGMSIHCYHVFILSDGASLVRPSVSPVAHDHKFIGSAFFPWHYSTHGDIVHDSM